MTLPQTPQRIRHLESALEALDALEESVFGQGAPMELTGGAADWPPAYWSLLEARREVERARDEIEEEFLAPPTSSETN